MALSSAPILTNVTGGAGLLNVLWSQVAGSVLRYVIYYGTAPGVYTSSLMVPVSSLANPAEPNYLVTGLMNNVTYWIRVSAVEAGTETETEKSNELSAVAIAAQVVTQPYNLKVAAGNGTVTLSWGAAPADGYRIEYTRDTSSPREWNGTGAVEGNSPINIEGNVNEYTLTGLQNNNGSGAPYFFRIASRQGETYSPPTEEVVAIPQANMTAPMHGNYTKISLQAGLNLMAVPVLPGAFTPDTYNLGKFMGASQVLWKAPGSSNFTARLISLPNGATKTLLPMEALLVIMPSSGTKYLFGNSWKNV